MKAFLIGLTSLAAVVVLIVPGSAWVTRGDSWGAGSTVTMHMQLGSGSGSFIDGASSWNQVGEWALARWNGRANVAFSIVRASTANTAWDNGVNNVYWSARPLDGGSWGDVLAYTYSWNRGGRTQEADVMFDSNRPWNSYRGNWRSNPMDVYRVAVHEFGHVLGLLHPDEHGQSRTAIMNKGAGNTDDIRDDDIDGVVAIYGSVGSSNRSPSVTAGCSPCTVDAGGSVALTASASDPDGDALSYAWTISGGSLGSSTSASTTWTAPSTAGTVTATVTVTDSHGATASSSVSITVTVADRLRAGGRLLAGQAIVSPNGRYRLVYQSDGNLVLYDLTAGTASWFTATTGSPGQVALQSDGNLVVYSAGNAALWFSGTAGNNGSILYVQNDGNLVLYSAAGAPIWWYARGGTLIPIPGGLATVSGCVVTVVSTGQGVSISGTLAATDCAAPARSAARGDVYVFQGTAGQTVTITMTAAFDTFLNLIGPTGSVVASDDDSGGGTNSRIQIRLTLDGVYRIEATAYDGAGVGAYTLTVN